MSVGVEIAVGERLKFGEFELAPIARTLWRHGEEIRLGSRALDILIALASRPGQIVSKDDLTKMVWRGALVDETALRVGISAVRKALGNGGDRYITTVPGRGYCFVLDVETTEAEPTPERPHVRRLRPQRLPGQIARVVGRDDVIVALATETTSHRLLSLVGAGGIGKTTVAIAAADLLRSDFDAVAFVDLAPITNGTQIAAAAITALGLNLRLQDYSIDEIAATIEHNRVLVVLDTCEHLVDAVAAFVEGLLSNAPAVTILATSRERLRAAGEWVHQLAPLNAPPEFSSLSVEELRAYPAVELFEERAACALGGYQISSTDVLYVAEICRRLEGIALAIELAAGRLPGLGVHGLANSLKESFSILTHGRRMALPRHQTLRATLDWSYQLLSPEDQAALSCLSVFSGSFTLEDAAFLTDPSIPPDGISERLTSLIEKSLVVAISEGRMFRYRLLDTTRAYAQAKLEEGGEAVSRRQLHAKRFLEVCRASTPDEEGESSLRQATADIRAALDWSLARGGDPSLGVDLASAATPVFLRLCLLREHKKHLDLALDHISISSNAAPMSEKALRSEMALRMAAVFADYYTSGRGPDCEKQLQRASDIARDIGDQTQELKALWMLYGWAGNVGNYRQELLYARQFEAATRGSGNMITVSRRNRMLAHGLSHLGQHACAQQHIEEALRPSRIAISQIALHAYDADDRTAARSIYARILWLRGYSDDAKTEAEQCLTEALQVGHEQSTCWAIIFNICPVAIWLGDFSLAETLVDVLLERSERIFQHYYDWGLLYRRFLEQTLIESSRAGAIRFADLKPDLHAQVDLFATFDVGYVEPDALARVRADESIWCGPELLRAQARHAIVSGNNTAQGMAEATLLHSLDLAKRHEAKAWELRTATTLASFYLQSGRVGEARVTLEPTLEQFKQGHRTRDFQKAMSVLSELRC